MGAHFSSLNEHSTEPAGRNPDNVLGAILLISTSGEVTELYTYSTYIPYFSEYWGVLQRPRKKYADFVKQQPGRARPNS